MKARTIGVLAREVGVNVETIRFYEREGLLRRPPRPGNGWRVYGDDAVWTLRYIRRVQSMGFTLRDIRELGRCREETIGSCHAFRKALKRRLAEMETEISRLARVRGEIEATLASCRASSGRCGFPGCGPFLSGCGLESALASTPVARTVRPDRRPAATRSGGRSARSPCFSSFESLEGTHLPDRVGRTPLRPHGARPRGLR